MTDREKEIARMERARTMIDKSDFDPDAKEGLHRLLDKAGHAANGCGDKSQAASEVLRDLCIEWTRHVVTADDAMRQAVADAVAKHKAECKGAIPPGKLGVLYAFRWPLALVASAAVFSPHLGAILSFAREALK